MNKLINKSSYLIRLENSIKKYLLGDKFSREVAHMFNIPEDSLNKIFTSIDWNTINLDTPKLDIYHKFKSRNFDEFVDVMYPIFEASFKKYNFPTTQILNVLRLAAYESGYGTSPRGALGYNFGGIKWENNPRSRTYKYKHTTYSGDGIEYVDFDSLQDYADYKVHLLNDTYHALNAANTNEFVDRLHGNNPSKKSYSANKDGYKTTLNTMKSFDKAYERYIKDNKL